MSQPSTRSGRGGGCAAVGYDVGAPPAAGHAAERDVAEPGGQVRITTHAVHVRAEPQRGAPLPGRPTASWIPALTAYCARDTARTLRSVRRRSGGARCRPANVCRAGTPRERDGGLGSALPPPRGPSTANEE